MKPRVLLVLGGLTAGVLLVGFLATRGPAGPGATERASSGGERLFPDLRANADAIVELRVSQSDASARIVRDAGSTQWRVATLGGYPANADRVRDTVRAMIDATVIEKKTARKESHAAIGLEDPSNAGARSVLVEAIDAQGGALARLVLGDIVPGTSPTFDPNAVSRFVRRADEDQSYIVAGRFPADPSSTAWVVRSIIEIPGSRVREVRITHPTGPEVIASRQSEADELAILDIPSGRTVKDQTQVSRLAQALAFLTLESVKPASEGPSIGGFDAATTFDLVTFDHLLIRARVVAAGEEYWVRLEAMPEPAAAKAEVPAAGVSGAPSANAEVSIDDPAPEEPTNGMGSEDEAADSTRDAARAEAARLNEKLAPWIFQVSPSKGEQLTLTLDALLTPSAIQGPELPEAGAPADTPPPPPLPTIAPDAPAGEPAIDPAEKLFPDSRP